MTGQAEKTAFAATGWRNRVPSPVV